MPRKQSLSYLELYAREKERVIDRDARLRAGIEGRPAESKAPNDSLEAMAWNNADPAVTPDHLNEIAMQTVQELMAEKDPAGQPQWTLEQIEQAVKYRQTMAVYPWRHLTFETGIPEHDIESRVKAADRAAKRYSQQAAPQAAAGDWEEVDESQVAAVGMGQPQQMQQQSAMTAGMEADNGYSPA